MEANSLYSPAFTSGVHYTSPAVESGRENVLLEGLERAVVSRRGLAGLLLIPACVSSLINSLLKWHFPQEEVLEFRAEGTGALILPSGFTIPL